MFRDNIISKKYKEHFNSVFPAEGEVTYWLDQFYQ